MKPRIFSDFNGAYYPEFMLLTYHGLEEYLKEHGITLSDGLEVTIFDADTDECLEIDGVVRFGVIPQTEYAPCWYADIRGSKLKRITK